MAGRLCVNCARYEGVAHASCSYLEHCGVKNNRTRPDWRAREPKQPGVFRVGSVARVRKTQYDETQWAKGFREIVRIKRVASREYAYFADTKEGDGWGDENLEYA